MNRKDYILYIIHKGINLQNNQVVEIIGSIVNKDFILQLEHTLYDEGALKVYINYIDDSKKIEKIINGYSLYIEQDIKMYEELVQKKFARIIVKTEFINFNYFNENNILEYKNSMKKLDFVQDYFLTLQSQKTICCCANRYWAQKLRISEDLLWNKIYDLVNKRSKVLEQIDEINNLKLLGISIKTNLKTDLKIGFTSGFNFSTSKLKTIDGVEFIQNIPSLEIFTAPDKYQVNGLIVAAKPLIYNKRIIENVTLYIENGKVCNLKEYGLDKSLEYVGEVGILETITEMPFLSTLLDENTATHIGLGKAYTYGISELDRINISRKHLDVIIGDNSLVMYGYNENNEFKLIENGKFKIEVL